MGAHEARFMVFLVVQPCESEALSGLLLLIGHVVRGEGYVVEAEGHEFHGGVDVGGTGGG